MIYLFLANGFEEIEALCPLDLLRRAGLTVTTVGIGSEQIVGAHGICVQADIPDTMYRDANPEMLILPGGMPGSKNLDQSHTVDEALRVAMAKGIPVGAICAAPMVLGKRGYLRGVKATCFPGFEEYLEGAILSEQRVITDQGITTAAGMGVALEFGLALVGVLKGKDAADDLRRAVLAD
ncbi:MAG: DJ-1/PfpI family protein [Clostridia bacterium]|nr:DJ-1/PfpI family protein [Clostridia bacterium]